MGVFTKLVIIFGSIGMYATLIIWSNVGFSFPALPKEIKTKCKTLNWFGAIFLSVLTFIFIFWYWLAKFIIWICTTKKKELDNDK